MLNNIDIMNPKEREAFAKVRKVDNKRLLTTTVGRESLIVGSLITFAPTNVYISNGQPIDENMFVDSFNGNEFWQIAVCFGSEWNDDDADFISSNNLWRRSGIYDTNGTAHSPKVNGKKLKGLPIAIMQSLTKADKPTTYKVVNVDTFDSNSGFTTRVYEFEVVE